MDDEKIIKLYFDRSEDAIYESECKYGRYCAKIADNILGNSEDAKECVNDTWNNAWNSIPPAYPNNLKAFFGKISRNIALNLRQYKNAEKRNENLSLAIDEFYEVIPDKENLEDSVVLKYVFNNFLETIPKKNRIIFVKRYWYVYSVKEIASDMGISESSVKVILNRTRNKLSEYLKEKEFAL